MVRIDLVRDKIRRLRESVGLLRAALPGSPADLARDRDRLDLVSFRVYLGLQEAIDLASHLIADEGWGPAASLRDHFAILAGHGVVDATLAAELGDGIKIRNLIGHAYAQVDPLRLHAAAGVLPDLLERFCSGVLAWSEAAGARED